MRTYLVGGSLVLLFTAMFVSAGDGAKEQPFKELNTEDLNGLVGDWEATMSTKEGWKGTLHAKIALKRNNIELSVFHHVMAVQYHLHNSERKPNASATGNVAIALIPYQKEKQL